MLLKTILYRNMDKRQIEHFMECIRGLVFDGSPELHAETLSLLEGLVGEDKAKAFMNQMPEIRGHLIWGNFDFFLHKKKVLYGYFSNYYAFFA